MLCLQNRVSGLLKTKVIGTTALNGGCVGDVHRLRLADGSDVVAKTSQGDDHSLCIEGWMLSYLKNHSSLPVPDVLHSDDHLLIMNYLDNSGYISTAAEHDAADHLAALHCVTTPTFGLQRNTAIGGLPQPNQASCNWLEFFRDQRLMHMGHHAHRVGRLPLEILAQLESFCNHLDRWIEEPAQPSLIHGDIWKGNVICKGNKISGFIDPAIYYADSEIEIAFTTLFDTFSDSFFSRYKEHRPTRPGFFSTRKDIYNLYPLLVHAHLFGGGYVDRIRETLSRFGF